MPKKSGRGRLKHKRQVRRAAPAVTTMRETSQSSPVLPVSVRQVNVPKSATAADELAAKHQYILSDIKRTFIIAAIVFAILFALYFTLR